MKDTLSLQHPIIILVRGLPGSGKSHLTKPLQTAIEALYGQGTVVTLDPDATDYDSQDYRAHVETATREGVDPKLHAYRFLRAQAYNGIAHNKVVIWNQPFTNLEIFNKMVANFKIQAAEHNKELSILVVEVAVDPEVARRRVLERKQQGGHGPDDAGFEKFVNDYFSFETHGYTTVGVQGDDEVAVSVARVLEVLKTV